MVEGENWVLADPVLEAVEPSGGVCGAGWVKFDSAQAALQSMDIMLSKYKFMEQQMLAQRQVRHLPMTIVITAQALV